MRYPLMAAVVLGRTIPAPELTAEERTLIVRETVSRAQPHLLAVLPPFAKYVKELTETLRDQGHILTRMELAPTFPWNGKCHNFGALDHEREDHETHILLTHHGKFFTSTLNYSSGQNVSLKITEFSHRALQELLDEKSYLCVHFLRAIASTFGATEKKLVEQLERLRVPKDQARNAASHITS